MILKTGQAFNIWYIEMVMVDDMMAYCSKQIIFCSLYLDSK